MSAAMIGSSLAATGGVAGPSMAPMRKPTCTPAPSAFAASRPYDFIPISSIEVTDGIHRLPALVATVTGDDGAHRGRAAYLARPQASRQGADLSPTAQRVRARPRPGRTLWRIPSSATLLAGKGIETVLSLVTAVDRILAASALSAGSHGAFEPPQDLALLVIARDKDMEGGHAANRLHHRCVERGIPSIVILLEPLRF